jgi:quercetin dioxygenase-like cupin family protein
MEASSVTGRATAAFGSEENPLVHPVTGERIVFHKRARDTGGELVELTISLAPGGFIAVPHVHPQQEERFEIRGAELMFRVGGKDRLYKPGEVVVVPKGVPHTWWNPSETEGAALIQLKPALDTETMFETFFGLAADGKVNAKGVPHPLQMMVLARHFHREARPAPPVSWIAVPLSYVLAPIGRLMGYRARYDKYSGPETTS